MTESPEEALQWSLDLARLAALVMYAHRSAAPIERSFTILDVRRSRRARRTRDATTERFPPSR